MQANPSVPHLVGRLPLDVVDGILDVFCEVTVVWDISFLTIVCEPFYHGHVFHLTESNNVFVVDNLSWVAFAGRLF